VTLLPGLGGRIHRLRAFGHDVLRTPHEVAQHKREPFFWGGYVMAPWSGRIAARPTSVAGRVIDVPANFRDGTAIHGQVHSSPWDVTADGELTTTAGGDGWPWRYSVSSAFAIVGRSLRIEQTVANLDDAPMPAGIGLHPWYRRPVLVQINADLVFDSNVESAAAPRSVDQQQWDARGPNGMADGLDATWARLDDPPVTLRWPDPGVHATMRMSSRAAYVVAASPTELDAIAVEPQTHAPQGLRRLINGEPGALTLVDPGGSLSLTTELTFDMIDSTKEDL
jgi:aldose 1-epimerase